MLINPSREIVHTLLLLSLFIFAPTLASALPAFPGAQGGGAASVGGRGGRTIEVTNLNDSGPGSLRACVYASGPRTCVFRVGGTIELLSQITIANPYLTVAGQTAPGGGILLSGKKMASHMLAINTHNVIFRYIRIRKGYSGNGNDNASLMSAYNNHTSIYDHISGTWNQDEGMATWGDSGLTTKDITFSYNLLAEGLKGHSTSFLTGGGTAAQQTNIDFHHNLTMNNTHRNPLLKNKSSRIVNNIWYNNGWYVARLKGGISADVIGNKYKDGLLNHNQGYWPFHEVEVTTEVTADTAPGVPSIFLSGNVGWNQPSPIGDQWLLGQMVPGEASPPEPGNNPVPGTYRRGSPLANTTYPIIAEPVANLESSLLPIVGASQRLTCDGTWVFNRDSTDTRLVTQYQNNTGNNFIVSNESQVGGFPTIASGTPCADADRDGMPDVWERASGLNPNSGADANSIAASGYTNREEYINGTGSGTPPPPPPPPASCTPTTLNVAPAVSDGGYAYQIGGSFGTSADNSTSPTHSALRFFENGLEMGPAHSLHADIRNLGAGRVSHWSEIDGAGESIRFSASNNTDPRTNGRSYAYCVLDTSPLLPPGRFRVTP